MRALSAVRSGIALALGAALAFGSAGGAAAQDIATRQALALDLARVLIDEQTRQGFMEQVTASILRVVGSTLQQRLNRRLQDLEGRALVEIVQKFVQTTLTPERTQEIAARAYASHFTEPELRALLEFQRSEVGRKAARLAPVIGLETAQAVEAEIQQSPAMPRMLEDLQRAFPVLRSPESP